MRPAEYALYASFLALYAVCAAATIFHPTDLPKGASAKQVWDGKSNERDNVIGLHCIFIVAVAVVLSDLLGAAYFVKPVKFGVLAIHVILGLIPNNYRHTFWVLFLAIVDGWLITRF